MKCKYYPVKSCDGDRCYSCDAKSEVKVDRSHPQSRHLEVGDYTADTPCCGGEIRRSLEDIRADYTADLTKDGYRLEGNEWLPGPDASPGPQETGADRRRAILREVEGCVCRDRQNSYGDAEDNFRDIAEIVNIVLAEKLRMPLAAEDIAIFNVAQKLARIKTSPNHLDNWVDMAGYAVCGGGIIKSRVE